MYLTRKNYHYLSHTKRCGVEWKTCTQTSNHAQVDDTMLKGRMSLKGALQLLQNIHSAFINSLKTFFSDKSYSLGKPISP